MTENEAIKIFNDLLDVPCEMLVKYDSVIKSEKKQALVRLRTAEEIAIKALEKQMKLNEMGDCYIIPKNGVFEVNGVDINLAIQKQIPKKIVHVKLRPTEWGSGFRCPECEAEQTETEFCGYGKSDKKITFCWGCGQKLDWSDED